MKKYFIPLIIASMTLVGCNAKNSSSEVKEFDRTSLSIITPTGAPALAFYNYAGLSNFETNSVPTNIVAMMAAGQKDVAVLPTNAGIQAITGKNAPYQIAATITFGNFYIASLGNDANETMDAGDNILLFQKGNVPDKIFHYVYGDTYDANISYVSAVSDAAAAATSGSFVDAEGNNVVPNYVLLAQPVLTNVLSKKENVKVYADIQAKYKEKSNGLDLFQASVFIKKSVAKETAQSFLDSLKGDIETVITKPETFNTALEGVENANTVYGIAPAAAANVTKNNNGMGLGFKAAKENKTAVENFLKLFNIEGVNEEVYF